MNGWKKRTKDVKPWVSGLLGKDTRCIRLRPATLYHSLPIYWALVKYTPGCNYDEEHKTVEKT